MEITILGSGTCIPSKTRGSSGYYIETSQSRILLDCGNGTTWKLEQIGVYFADISHIFISHMHPDHTSDLIPFLFANKYPYNRKRTRPLEVWGPTGFKDFLYKLNKLYNNWLNPELLIVNEFTSPYIEFDDFKLTSKPANHSIDGLIYKIDSGDKSIVYSGDTDVCENIVDLARNADLLIIECSTPDGQKIPGHLSPKDIIEIANKSNPKKIVLTHFYPRCDEVDILDIIKPHIKEDCIKAEDLIKIEI